MAGIRALTARPAIFAFAACLATQLLWSNEPENPRISAFAPAEDLLTQVDFYIERLSDALADPAKFDEARQSRAWKDANTLAVLAMILAAHDESHPLKASAPAIAKAAQALALAESDAGRASEALAAIKRALAETASDEPAPEKLQKVASIAALMKQVPLVHAGLRRSAAPARLAKMAKESAGQSATLAAIAQAAMLDDQYVKSPEMAAQWSELCVRMRDAAAEVNAAIRAQDAPRVTAGLQQLLESCDACHEKFRR